MAQLHPNERENVFNLQRYLRQLSFDDPDIPPLPLDGIFDSATRESLLAYQRKKGLTPTGQADRMTWEALFLDYLVSIDRNTRADGFSIFPLTPSGYAVYPNEEHFLVQVIQYMLNELREIYTDIPQNSQSGVFDAATGQGVLEFQRRNGLPESERVDKETWNALAAEYRRLSDRWER